MKMVIRVDIYTKSREYVLAALKTRSRSATNISPFGHEQIAART